MKYVAVVGGLVILLALMFVSPLLTIDTLFGLNIAYTVWTCLSVMWLNLATFGGLGLSIRSLKK